MADLNIRSKPVYLLEENMQANCELWFGNNFLGMLSKVPTTKLDLIKLENFCFEKSPIKKIKK